MSKKLLPQMHWWCGYSQTVSFSWFSGLPNFKNDLVFSYMSITIPSPSPKWTNLLFCRSLQCETVTQIISDLIYHYFPLHTLPLLTLGVRISRCCAKFLYLKGLISVYLHFTHPSSSDINSVFSMKSLFIQCPPSPLWTFLPLIFP